MTEENKFKGMGSELAKGIHASKSYTNAAFLTLLGYYLGCYVVGLVLNLMYLSQANKSKNISGVSPSGRSFLLIILWVHLFIPIMVILGLVGVISLPFL